MAPRDEAMLVHMLHTALRYDDGPVALRYPRGNGVGVALPRRPSELEIGTGEILREADGAGDMGFPATPRVALLGYGTGVGKALEAADILAEHGISVTVADARFAKPIDAGLAAQLAAEHDLLVTVEEGVLAGGFGSAVWETLSDAGLGSPARILRVGLPDRYVTHGAPTLLHEEVGFTGAAHRRADRGRGGRALARGLSGPVSAWSPRAFWGSCIGGRWEIFPLCACFSPTLPRGAGRERRDRPAHSVTQPRSEYLSAKPMKRVRLDNLLSERGMFPSRSRAAASVLAGEVLLLPERRRAEKPGQLVAEDVQLELADVPPFVSRGGIKLANALDTFGVEVDGRGALDVGASTGGFTDCLLKRGAAHVIALDVAYGQLDWSLRSDERVTVIERVNARALERDALPYAPDLVVIDVSFISVAKVLPAVLTCVAERFDCLAMIKPQFEVGRAGVGKGGVVRDAELRRGALVAVGRAAQALGAAVLGYASSGLPGPKGNLETFVWLAEAGRAAVPDLEAAAREVEP